MTTILTLDPDAVPGVRVAVDTNAVLTDNAILWLAKQASGDVLAPEA